MTDTPTTGSAPSGRAEAARARMEATRSAFRRLAESLSEEEWSRKSPANPAWTNGQLLSHVMFELGYIPRKIELARRGKGLPGLPPFLFNRLNDISTRRGSKKNPQDRILQNYDALHARAIEALDGVREDEWEKGAKFFGEYQTIEHMFERYPSHFEEHAEQIRSGLRRASA